MVIFLLVYYLQSVISSVFLVADFEEKIYFVQK